MIKLFFFCTIVCCTFACKQNTTSAISNKTEINDIRKVGFVHAVYFYLIDEATEIEKKEFEKALLALSEVETIVDLHWGPPAGTPRKVVDNTYDYAFIPQFEDKAGHDAYQIDPIHTKFVEEFEYLFKEVKIYDNFCN